MTKNGSKQQLFSSPMSFVVLFAWLAGIAWVGLTPAPQKSIGAERRTNAALAHARTMLERFIHEFHEVPWTLTELRAYAATQNSHISSYDAFGQIFEYVRLDPQHYVMRSFGSDGTQNTVVSAPDLSVAQWNDLLATPVYKYLRAPQLALYPSALLSGADSPNHQWQAHLYSDRSGNTRRLMVRHREKKNLFMLAPHDMVEEFLWLPNGYQIVFTATSSVRYRDGIYLWNLVDDTVVNFAAQGQALLGLNEAQEKPLWISLAGIVTDGPTLLVYMAPAMTQELDPTQFLSGRNLVAVRIDEKNAKAVRLHRVESLKNDTVFDTLGTLNANLDLMPSLNPAQQQWINLPLRGDIEDVIVGWQDFVQKNATSNFVPYSLWILSCLYSDAFRVAESSKTKDSDVLRTYGAEIAQNLMQMAVAPSYVRAFGAYSFSMLTQNRPLPFHISSLHGYGK